MALAIVQDHVIHHSANLAAVVIPVMSVWLNAPVFFTVTTAALGTVWYLILIGEKLYDLRSKWRERHKPGPH